MVAAGSLNRRIVIEQPSSAQDSSTGQPKPVWSTFATVWARRLDVRGSERHAAEQDIAARTATFRLHFLAGVTERMRIVDAGITYDITGIAGDEMDNWLELTAEARNPAAEGS